MGGLGSGGGVQARATKSARTSAATRAAIPSSNVCQMTSRFASTLESWGAPRPAESPQLGTIESASFSRSATQETIATWLTCRS